MLALSSFGIRAAIAGKVGKDEYGNIYKNKLSAYELQDDIISEYGPTGSSIILVTPDCERTMNTFLGVNRNFGPDDINEANLCSSRYFYTTGYMWDTELQKAAVTKALDISKKNDIKVAFDVADPFAVKRSKDDFLRLLRNNVSIAFANSEEAAILFDTENIKDSLFALSSIVDYAVVKDGKRGSYVGYNGKEYFIPTRNITPEDTTGAGDMYAAAFSTESVPVSLHMIQGYLPLLCFEIVRQFGAQFSEEKEKVLKIISSKAGNTCNLKTQGVQILGLQAPASGFFRQALLASTLSVASWEDLSRNGRMLLFSDDRPVKVKGGDYPCR